MATARHSSRNRDGNHINRNVVAASAAAAAAAAVGGACCLLWLVVLVFQGRSQSGKVQ